MNSKRTVYGVGINDSDYTVAYTVNNHQTMCPIYMKWRNMLKRAYDKTTKINQPSYVGVTVCSEWHSFMTFRKWMITQDWEGKELDKDILYPNNKIYSPKTCCFVSCNINTLFSDCLTSKGNTPTGVHFSKNKSRYVSYIRLHGGRKHLGSFNTEEEAHQVYLVAKVDYIKTFYKQVPKEVKKGLKRHVKLLKKTMIQ